MALFWGAEGIKNTLPEDLQARVNELKTDPHDEPGPERVGWLPLHNGKNAELIIKIPGGVAVRVSREKLRKLFSVGIDIQVYSRL
jgi:hypothetical protein